MLLIWMLILMWIHWLLIPVMMVSVCLDLRLDCVYSEGDGLACFLLGALVRKIGYIIIGSELILSWAKTPCFPSVHA